ncbi:MAG: ATP-binding cassette domain-containing protein [SAR202 cluster bacterium]|nr:ATP-binding cassette domain-containing protein [SAR202 cluster bacterium]
MGEGEVVGIIGPNGAGKSTLFNVICSVWPSTAGQVLYRGEGITGCPHLIDSTASGAACRTILRSSATASACHPPRPAT